jgi:hypothetical protein
MSKEKPTAALGSWRQVVIPNNDVAKLSAQALMQGVAKAWRAAGCPDDAEVFHSRNGAMDHVYYFSPGASAIVGVRLLQEFYATTCKWPENFAIPAFKVAL